MAPGYRTATTTRRGNRSGYPEHDDFEGLPVRQWRLQEVDIAPPPAATTAHKNDRWSIELPHGMPKDYNLLPSHSQELLRAARSGALYKRKAPPEEEDAIDMMESGKLGGGPGLGDADRTGDKKASATKSDSGIKVRVWRRVAREAEAPAPTYLAKRHKNTVTLPSKASATQFSGPTVTRVTVRRIDAAGNTYERTITINDDEQLNHLDGEIVSTTVIAAPVAADPVAQQQPTPNRKRPPPPPHRKKLKGPGRGRKKKLGVGPLPLPLKPGASATPAAGPDGSAIPKTETATEADGIKQEDKENTGTPDVEMGENSAIASDDEEGDEDDGDEGEDGEGNEEAGSTAAQGDDPMADATEPQTPDGRQDQVMEDAVESVESIQPSSIEEPTDDSQAADEDTEVIDIQQQEAPGLLNPAPPHLSGSLLFSPRQHEGSPLKNVMLQSPTEPKNMDFPSISTVQEATSGVSEAQSATDGMSPVTEPVQRGPEAAAADMAVVEMSAQTTVVTPEGDEAEDSAPALLAFEEVSASQTLELTHESGGDLQSKTSVHMSSFVQQSYQTSSTHSVLPSLREPPAGSALSPPQPMMGSGPAAEDDGMDLLGGLERELDRQSRTSITPAEGARGDESSSADKPDVHE